MSTPAPTPSSSPFADFAANYRENGLSVIPCAAGAKFPGQYNAAHGWRAAWDWQKFCDRMPTGYEVSVWDRWPDAGICMPLGAASGVNGLHLVAIDIDTDVPAEVTAIKSVLPGSPCAKRGAKGETQFYLASAAVVNRPFNDANKRRMLDLLASGRQTVMPPSVHPDLGTPYVWITPDALDGIDIADLPILPDDISDRFAAALAPFGYAPEAPRLGAAGSAELGIDNPHRSLNDAALANLDAWVPALQLHGCRQYGSKFKAVAHWRPSSSGRPLTKRATNLAISPDGIKDCGENKGYTPLDLVMAACGADLDTAFSWLQARVAPAKPIVLTARAPAEDASPPKRGNLSGLGLVLATVDGIAQDWSGLADPDTGEIVEEEVGATMIPAAPEAALETSPPLNCVGNRPIMPTAFVFRDPSTLPRRQWLYGKHLIRGEISLTLAPGGLGKTSLAIAETLSLVSGRKLLHDDPGEQRTVWMWNGEEPTDELERRFGAAMIHYGLTGADCGGRLFTDTGHDLPLVLVEQGRDGTRIAEPLIDRLVEALKGRKVDVMLVDPFVSTHSVNENDNSAIQRAASAWKTVAHRAGVAIGLAHHVRKLAGREATAEDSRGGDSLVSKARDARALNPMSKEDALRHGVPVGEHHSYFSTGTGGKSNMSPKRGHRTWFHITSVGLGNGASLSEPEDRVAVVTPWAPSPTVAIVDPTAVMRLAKVMAGEVWRCAPQSQKREDWIGRAVARAFGLGDEDGFQARAKEIIAQLEKDNVLVRRDATNRKREIIKTMILGDLSRFENLS
jgi:hypothetical protein